VNSLKQKRKPKLDTGSVTAAGPVGAEKKNIIKGKGCYNPL